MKIDVYTLAWNEEFILPYFLRHYERFCDRIFVYDNESTDKTAAICDAHPKVTRSIFKTEGTHSETLHQVPIRNECWKKSKEVADWAFVVDCDEFVHHHDLAGFLTRMKERDIHVVRAYGFEMLSDYKPYTDGLLTDEVRTGVQSGLYSKPCLLNPNRLAQVHFLHGAHHCTYKTVDGREGNYLASGSLKMLHYKRMGWNYFIERNNALRARSNPHDVKLGQFEHYRWPEEVMRKQFLEMLKNAVDVTS